jgi:DNA modification methylase
MELYNADCIDKMKELHDGSIDLIVADLPYGRLYQCKWDIPIDLDDMWEQVWRVLKPNGVCCLFGDMKFSAELIKSQEKHFKYEIAWFKEHNTNPLTAKIRMGSSMEYALLFYKKQPTFNYLEHHKVNKGKNGTIHNPFRGKEKEQFVKNSYEPNLPLNFISANREVKKLIKQITQKPQKVLEYIIKYYSLKDETVMDFCMGSGSTGVACKTLGRKFVGIELNKEHYDACVDRLQ